MNTRQRIAKLQALADSTNHPGERQAALAAIERIKKSAPKETPFTSNHFGLNQEMLECFREQIRNSSIILHHPPPSEWIEFAKYRPNPLDSQP